MWGTVVLLCVGLLLIVKGGDVFVDAAGWMAEKTGIPKFIIGATVVSLATTLPEMLVSFMAAGSGRVDMAIGNAVGSVTANTGLILGIALLCIPAVAKRGEYMLKSLLMLAAALVLVVGGLVGKIGLVANLLLLCIFAVAMWDNLRTAAKSRKRPLPAGAQAGGAAKPESAALTFAAPGAVAGAMAGQAVPVAVAKAARKNELAINLMKFVFGAAAVVFGSQLLVDNGSALALLLGVPERIIAVSVIAIGTSLPELVTTLSAIAKKQGALSFGNIIGANILDLTLILPVSSLVAGRALPVAPQFAAVDLPVCLLVGCVAIVPMLFTQKFSRWQGAVMVCLYAAYLVVTTMVLG